MPTLLVLRHAKSSWADSHADDWERPLTDRGERDATRVGELLRRLSLVPDSIVTSDAVRAEATARRAAESSGYAGKITHASRLYHASPEAVIEVVRDTPAPPPNRLMIVGHNPGLEDLVSSLTGEDVGLSTATLVQIDVPVERWSDIALDRTARLVASWQPGDY